MDIGISRDGAGFGLSFPNGWRVQVTLLVCRHMALHVLPAVQIQLDEPPTESYLRRVEEECAARGDYHQHWVGDDFKLLQFMTEVALRSPPATHDAASMIEAVRRK